ncbi:squalene epoxidase, partial [Hortaea werneckii]
MHHRGPKHDLMPIQEKKRLAKERRQVHHDADVVIVGAGILGCAIAVALGNQGRSVILLERSLKEPDRIVGELLQPGGVAALEKLGMRDCLEEIDAIKVFGYDVIFYGDEVRIPYPANVHEGGSGEGQEKEKDVSHTDEMRGMKRKRPEGRSFHHGRFIQRLRQKAMQNENVEVFEATATELVRNDYNGQILGVEATVQGETDCFFGGLTIIADGYASKFRKQFREDTPVVRSKFWGLELIDA